jgi:hypothetical protein
MSKHRQSNKESKKKSLLTPKERKTVKKTQKQTLDVLRVRQH